MTIIIIMIIRSLVYTYMHTYIILNTKSFHLSNIIYRCNVYSLIHDNADVTIYMYTLITTENLHQFNFNKTISVYYLQYY